MTEPSHVDRRTNRTRRQLRDALMALILERGYNAVTVEDITGRADLGRTTFYLHYKDKEELLVESLEAIAEDLRVQVERLVDQNLEEGVFRPNPVAVAFRHAQENSLLYRIILQGEGSSRASRSLREIIKDAAMDYFSRRLMGLSDGVSDVPAEVVAAYFSGSLMGFITWWLENDLPYDADEAADLFLQLFFGGARQVLHLPFDPASTE